MTTEAELGVMQPQAKDCQTPPKLAEARNEFYPRASKGNTTLPTPSFGPLILILDFWLPER